MKLRRKASGYFALLMSSVISACSPVPGQAGSSSPSVGYTQTPPPPDFSGHNPHWIKAVNVACWAYSSDPHPAELIVWSPDSGTGCDGGTVSGTGREDWYRADGYLDQSTSANFVHGLIQGKAEVKVFPDKEGLMVPFMTLSGTMTNSVLDGKSTVTFFKDQGSDTYTAVWKNGFFQEGLSGDLPAASAFQGMNTVPAPAGDQAPTEASSSNDAHPAEAYLYAQSLQFQSLPASSLDNPRVVCSDFMDRDSQFDTTYMNEDGFEPCQQSITAATQGNPAAEVAIGDDYYTESQELQKRASDIGTRTSFQIDQDTEQSDRDMKEAEEWYEKAANQGNALAEDKLGYMYYKGYGVTADDPQALIWYKKAAAQGNADAQAQVNTVLQDEEAQSAPAPAGGGTCCRMPSIPFGLMFLHDEDDGD